MKKLMTHYAWSLLYWTNDKNSDVDIRWVFIEDLDNIILWKTRNIFNDENEEDYQLYELGYFLDLCYKNNPNILETLFCPSKHIIDKDDLLWNILYTKRKDFLSKKVVSSFLWYIDTQIKKMNRTNSILRNIKEIDPSIYKSLWLKSQLELMDLNEKDIEYIIEKNWLDRKSFNSIIKPKHSEFLKIVNNTMDLNYYEWTIWQKIYNNVYWVYFSNDKSKSFLNKDWNIQALKKFSDDMPDAILVFNKDWYEQALKEYKWYHSWKNTRNTNRLELQKKHWYDTKFMLHIFRLYWILEEILSNYDLTPDRRGIDNEFLKEIKNGMYDYEYILETLIPERQKRIDELLESNLDNFPDEPYVNIDELKKDIYKKAYCI